LTAAAFAAPFRRWPWAKLEETTRRLTRDIFSFVAGTSTGAIMAALVAAGVPAARILSLYEQRAVQAGERAVEP
jgi:patatin-like phospholipase/acyl hydrolase